MTELDAPGTGALVSRILFILFPIVAIVTVGFLYGLRHKPEMTVANRLNMDIFVPALILGAMASEAFEPARYAGLAAGAALLLLTCGLLAWPLASRLGLNWRTFVPPMMFNNSANIGIPLAVLAFGEEALAAGVVLYSVSNVMHFSLGVRMLDPHASLRTLWYHPTLLAASGGLAIALLGLPVWQPIVQALQLLGNVAIPLLLFALGVRMQDVRFDALGASLAGALARPLFGMGLGWLLGQLLGLGPRDSALLIIFGALPPAVMNFLFAERYGQEPERVAAIVLVGNLAALLVLPVALGWVL